MITCVCMNPAIDKTIELDAFTYGGMNRVQKSIIEATGKAVNVAVVLRRMGDDVSLIAVNYRDGGAALERRMAADGIPAGFIWSEGSLRVNIKALDRSTGKVTEINDKGAPVGPDVIAEAERLIADAAERSDYVALTGSLPPGVPRDFYRRVIESNAGKTRFVLDCDGEMLREGIKAKPFLIKPNSYELGLLCGHEPESVDEVVCLAREIAREGVKYVVVSMGGDGAVIVSETEAYFSPIIDVPVISTVGAGDSMVAGLMHGFMAEDCAPSALKWGVACGNAAVMTPGTGLVDPDDLKRLIDMVTIEKI